MRVLLSESTSAVVCALPCAQGSFDLFPTSVTDKKGQLLAASGEVPRMPSNVVQIAMQDCAFRFPRVLYLKTVQSASQSSSSVLPSRPDLHSPPPSPPPTHTDDPSPPPPSPSGDCRPHPGPPHCPGHRPRHCPRPRRLLLAPPGEARVRDRGAGTPEGG